MNGYILDSNVFNRVLDGAVQLPVLDSGLSYFATHVQLDELAATRDELRRNKLLEQFLSIDPESLPTESLVLGISRLGFARLSDGVLYSDIRGELDKRNGGKANNAQDALTAETAIKGSLVLVAEDADLLEVVSQLGGSAIHIREIDPSGTNKSSSG